MTHNNNMSFDMAKKHRLSITVDCIDDESMVLFQALLVVGKTLFEG